MQNLILGYGNLIDGGTVSGGAWQPTLPLTNLQDRDLSAKARTINTSAGSTRLVVDLGTAENVRLLALAGHNLSSEARLRWRLANDVTLSNLVYDSGYVDAWPAMYSTDTLEWEASNWWSGRMPERDRKAYPALSFAWLPTFRFARYFAVDVDDASNPDGYIQLGRAWISDAWQTTKNFDYGHQLGIKDGARIEQALGGTEFFDPVDKIRQFDCRLSWLGAEEAWQRAFDLTQRVGVTGEVLVIPDADDAINLVRRSFLGRLEQCQPLQIPRLVQRTMQLTIRETL